MIVAVIYCSPSQNDDEFNSFLSNFEKLLSSINKCKPFFSVVTSDFNAESFFWWSNDINTSVGSKFFSLTSSNRSQIINNPTHIQRNNSSGIDLIFTDQPNLSVNSGVHASLLSNFYHQIVHSSFNLDISYLPPYRQLIWSYKKVDSTNTKKALNMVNQKKLFERKDVNAQVIALHETILNVF